MTNMIEEVTVVTPKGRKGVVKYTPKALAYYESRVGRKERRTCDFACSFGSGGMYYEIAPTLVIHVDDQEVIATDDAPERVIICGDIDPIRESNRINWKMWKRWNGCFLYNPSPWSEGGIFHKDRQENGGLSVYRDDWRGKIRPFAPWKLQSKNSDSTLFRFKSEFTSPLGDVGTCHLSVFVGNEYSQEQTEKWLAGNWPAIPRPQGCRGSVNIPASNRVLQICERFVEREIPLDEFFRQIREDSVLYNFRQWEKEIRGVVSQHDDWGDWHRETEAKARNEARRGGK